MTRASPKRRKPARMGVRAPSQIRCQAHLQWVRGHECALAGVPEHTCWGSSEAHHVRKFHDGGTGLKPGDDKVVPTCSGAHRMIHDKGEDQIRRDHGIDLVALAQELWRQSPHRHKWEREND